MGYEALQGKKLAFPRPAEIKFGLAWAQARQQVAQFHSLAFRHSAQEQNRNPPTPRTASSLWECWSGPGCREAKGQGLAQDAGSPRR